MPDVSAQAAEGTIIFRGADGYLAGTSEAAPLWAGYVALVNQLAASYGSPSAGFANPELYKIATTSAYDTKPGRPRSSGRATQRALRLPDPANAPGPIALPAAPRSSRATAT